MDAAPLWERWSDTLSRSTLLNSMILAALWARRFVDRSLAMRKSVLTHAHGCAYSTGIYPRRLCARVVIYTTRRRMNVPIVEESAPCWLVLVKLVRAVLEKAREATRRLILGVASVHIDDKSVSGILAVILEDALHVEMLVELPVGVAVAHQEELGASGLGELGA